MEWFKWRNAQWYRLTRGMTKEQKADLIDATADALEDGSFGVTPIADRMLKEAAEYSDKQRNRRTGNANATASHGEPSQTTDNHGEPRLTTDNHGEPPQTTVDHGEPRKTTVHHKKERQTEREKERQRDEVNPSMKRIEKSMLKQMTDRNTARKRASSGIENGTTTTPPPAPTSTPTRQPGKPRKPKPNRPTIPTAKPTATPEETEEARQVRKAFKADPYGFRDKVPAPLLPDCAVLFCEEESPEMALLAYRRELQRIGPDNFREIFWNVMDRCLVSEPVKRGALLMAHLKALGGLP